MRSLSLHRFKLHGSTVVVAVVVTFLVSRVVLSVGFEAAGSGGYCVDAEGFSSYTVYEHGWPEPFLYRIDCAGTSRLDWIPLPVSRSWRLWECDEESEFWLGLFLWDLAVGLAVVLCCTTSWELRRRRRERLLQFRLWEALLLVTLLAVGLGSLRYHRVEYKREEANAQALESLEMLGEEKDLGSFQVYSENCVLPDWALRLVGTELIPQYLWRYDYVLYEPGWDDSPEYFRRALPDLLGLKRLDAIEIETLPEGGELPIEGLAELPNLRELELWGHDDPRPLDIQMAESIARLSRLKKLTLAPVDGWYLTPEARRLIEERLPACEIEALEEH